MLERVIGALQSARSIDQIVVAGLVDDTRLVVYRRPVHFLPDQGSAVKNLLAGIDWLREQNPNASAVLISSSDIPAITGEIVDNLVAACRPFDYSFYYPLVTRETMEARFPGSKRTFVRLRNLHVAGGDIFIAQPDLADANPELWRAIHAGRKQAWRLALLIGLLPLLKALIRRPTLSEVEKAASRMFGRPVKIILTPYAEVAMDVDKPDQLELLSGELSASTPS